MVKKISLLLLLVWFAQIGIGQDNDFIAPEIDDEMTVNPDQNRKWRMGLVKYPAKPKTAWELGIHTGHFTLDGDVNCRLPGGFGVGLHLRKAIYYVFSLRLDMFYGQAYGLDAELMDHASEGGGLVESVFDDYENMFGWYPKTKTHYGFVNLQAIVNIGNVLFHQERNYWNLYFLAGIGLDTHQAMMDLYARNGVPYNTQDIQDLGLDFTVREERSMIKKEVDNFYDGKYETKGIQDEGIFRIADDYNVHLNLVLGFGATRKLNKRVNISFEHQVFLSDNDYLDGIKYRTASDQTNDPDIGHYTQVRMGINLGNLSTLSEPLYWLNPLDASYDDIANLKQRPVLDLSDHDGDGVVDMMDMEPESPVGARVDTRGITMDSDKDGIADFEDEEPFSPPGLNVDASGIAQVPEQGLSEQEVRMIVNEVVGDEPEKLVSAETDWFLPMIHFDLDKYYIKPEFFGQMKHVADMMKKYPEMCVTAQGHTDISNTNEYNLVLSYKRANAAITHLVDHYGVDRNRFRLMYGGEDNPIVVDLPVNYNNRRNKEMKEYMNRRVEFRTCEDTDFDMPVPENLKGRKMPAETTGLDKKTTGDKSSGY
jgi:outer membrane protein OmpA-like peptidoglycan-associated protein